MSYRSMFQGYFNKFDEIKKTSNIFKNKFWIKREFNKIKRLKKLKSYEINLAKDYPLLVASSIIYNKQKKFNIIDYGGGFGAGYLSVSRGINGLKNLKYYIIDLPEICKLGKKIFLREKNVFFLEKFPKIKNCDIFHFGSCLQYIDDWKLLLMHTIRLKPKYIIFSDLIAGDIDGFVTLQKFDGYKMPYRFYNIKEVISFIKKKGYNLILRNNYQVHFNGIPSVLPTKKFPKKNRLDYTSNLIFKKK